MRLKPCMMISILWITSLYGCTLEDSVKLNGSACGGNDIEFLGILGDNSLSDIRTANADQKGRYTKYHACPDEYPYCVYLQSGSVRDESKGVLCSSCEQGQLFCDSDAGGKKCTDVLTNKQHCGGCNIPCAGVCVNGKCSVNDCGSGTIPCEVESGDGSVRNVCVNPLSNLTCGATCANPEGEACSGDRECRDGRCDCKSDLTDCSGQCLNLHTDESCGTSCADVVACKKEEGQHCVSGKCECPQGLLLREGHCIDPKHNNKYCGATLISDGLSCPTDNGIYCKNGRCRCEDGLVKVLDENSIAICIDPLTNPNYCGASDNENSEPGQYTKCKANAQCKDGLCVCNEGYHSVLDTNLVTINCVSNDRNSCGARGFADSPDPTDKNYQGFVCPEGTFCNHRLFNYYQNDTIMLDEPLDVCVHQDKQCPEDYPVLYSAWLGTASACGDPNTITECHLNRPNDKFSELICECKPGFYGPICNKTDKCSQQYQRVCTNGFVCLEDTDNSQCVCPPGSNITEIAGTNVCVPSTNPRTCVHSSGSVTLCKKNEICENGTCIPCGQSQLTCMNKCMDKFDSGSSASPLLSLADRHIAGCDEDTQKPICEEGFAECNGNAWDGCETDLSTIDLTTNENCGMCGNVCSGDTTCSNQKCCFIETSSVPYVDGSGIYDNAECCWDDRPRKCMKEYVISGKKGAYYYCRETCLDDETDVTQQLRAQNLELG